MLRCQARIVKASDSARTAALAEKLHPEDVHRLMTRAFDLMLGEVYRYEGSLNRFHPR